MTTILLSTLLKLYHLLQEICMSYQVLARKWRPRTFQQMVGQEHALRMLINALEHQRLHHAYLFTGTRGVGKTTLARLLAKCLNCEKGITPYPCDQCTACQSIDAGRFLDLIEVDAASRTKVEDTREILDNVQYAPCSGRYKIYLIDEVHMLSGHSFNALLKTLEEPPAHVKFLLATTDPKRLPITILSRCLQFNLKRVPMKQITQQVEHICQAENITYETPALELLAHAADGSMRDALSLLDQAIAYCQHNITTSETRQMLGSIEHDAIFRLLQTLADNDGAKMLAEITAIAEFAPDFQQVLEDLLAILHQISLSQVIKNAPPHDERITQFAQLFSAEDIQLYYQIALIGRRDLPLAPNPTQGFEMVMLRMLAFQPVNEEKPKKDIPTNTARNPEMKTPESPRPNTSQSHDDKVLSNPMQWADILPQLKLTGLAQMVASNCTLTKIDNDKIELALSNTHQSMLNKKLEEKIEQALKHYFNQSITLTIKTTTTELNTPAKQQQRTQNTRLSNAVAAIKNDTTVQSVMELFNATLDPDSIATMDSI